MKATTTKTPVAIKVREAMISVNHHLRKKERKSDMGVRKISKPVQTVPIIWRAMTAVTVVARNPVPFESLLGILMAEKSRIVLPIWKVEFVWLTWSLSGSCQMQKRRGIGWNTQLCARCCVPC